MSGPLTPGSQVKITGLEHSPPVTRACKSLIGECGAIVTLLHFGKCALVELDTPRSECPQGMRRWSVGLDDLTHLGPGIGPRRRKASPVTGLTGSGSRIAQHAVWEGEEKSLCGELVRPLPFTGWSVPFSGSSRRACRDCAGLTADALPPESPD